MSRESRYIVYRNRFNEVKCYNAVILETGETYLRVNDLNAGHVKTFKNENVIASENNFDKATSLAKEAQEKFKPIPRPGTRNSNPEFRKKYNLDEKLEVCFTGFKKSIKNEMIEMAETADFFVRKSVSTKLDILVCGENAGWAKLARASEMNIALVEGLDGFRRFIETGEIDE